MMMDLEWIERTRSGSKRCDGGKASDDERLFKVPKLSREEEEEKLCLCFNYVTNFEDIHYWYIMDPLVAAPASLTANDCILNLMSQFDGDGLPSMFSTVAYDSKLFFIGGSEIPDRVGFPSAEASFIDMRFPNAHLQQAPLMITGKCRPVVAAVDGKIYVLGTSSYMTEDNFVKPWAEVFDIASNTWSDLPFPPDQALEHNRFGANYVYHERMNRIITSYPGSDLTHLWYFDITTCSWGSLQGMGNLRSILPSIDGRPAVVDDELYLLFGHHGKLFVVSLVEPAPMVPVHGLEKATESIKPQFDDNDVTPFLSHLGNGLLCLVWAVQEDRYLAHVYCLNFRVSKIGNGKLHAVIERQDDFFLRDVDDLRDCLPIVMRKTTTLDVDPEVCRQTTFPSEDSSRRSTRHARRVLVNGLPPGTDANTIVCFFTDNIVLEPGHNDTDPMVLDVYINSERNFAIVELSSEEQANSAMVLRDPQLNGVSLAICRPADYQRPPPTYTELLYRAFPFWNRIGNFEDADHQLLTQEAT